MSAQLSIRSFFQAKAPTYAPPPSSKPHNPQGSTSAAAQTTPPPPPASTIAPPPAAAPVRMEQTSDVPVPPKAQSGYTVPPLPKSLPREADIRLVSGSDINALRRINALLLPVSYSDNFYRRAVDPAASGPFSRVITWAHDGAEPKVVGGVVCCVKPDVLDGSKSNDDDSAPQNLYIQSLCLLSPYRSMGLVNAAIDNIVATAVANPELRVQDLTAHVWTENEEGIKWYEGRGFKRDDQPIRGYYMKLRPDSAWFVRRPVSASVRNSLPSASTPSTSSAPPRSVPPSATASIVNLPPMSGPPRAPNAPPLPRSQSYQNQRAEMEWNDLPEDMAVGRLRLDRENASDGSATSSRSSSAARKKRDRAYPAAAFGK